MGAAAAAPAWGGPTRKELAVQSRPLRGPSILLDPPAPSDAPSPVGPYSAIAQIMGDSGEGLVDAEARIQEQIEEREAERRRRSGSAPRKDPEKIRELESLRLAKSNLERQAEATAHPVRKQQIKLALAEIDKRLAVD
jgi:hypothetical protein